MISTLLELLRGGLLSHARTSHLCRRRSAVEISRNVANFSVPPVFGSPHLEASCVP